MNKNFPSYVKKIFDLFGDKARLVGGCVRDIVMNKVPNDWDFATVLTPDEMYQVNNDKYRVIPIGIKHGTLTFIIDGEHVEVTTLRIDNSCDGRHAQVKFVTNWEEDASRRDFTMNALYMDSQGNIYDYFGGMDHIKARKVVFVGDPATRIIEDGLRWFRMFRFASTLSFFMPSIAHQGIPGVTDEVEKSVLSVSRERIWSEIKKILKASHDSRCANMFLSSAFTHKISFEYFPKRRNDFENFYFHDNICEIAKMAFIFENSLLVKDFFKMSNKEFAAFCKYSKIVNDKPSWTESLLTDEYTQEDIISVFGSTHFKEYRDVSKYTPFRVKGRDLIAAGLQNNKAVQKHIKYMKADWKESGFTKTTRQLFADWGLKFQHTEKPQVFQEDQEVNFYED